MLNFASLTSLLALNQYRTLVSLIPARILLHDGYPRGCMVKLNCDAAFKLSKDALGIVVRDSTGSLYYVDDDLSCVVSPLHVEIIAVHSAYSLASNNRWL